MRTALTTLFLGMLALALVDTAGQQATAILKDAHGRKIGDATLTETPHGVLIHVNLTEAPAGVHAIHVHETGKCEAPSFTSAGAHFNPVKAQHGLQNPRGMHAGDLPNIDVPENGKLTVEIVAHDTMLSPGTNSLFDADGSALVIHEKADDYHSDPAGNAGDRVACGVISRNTSSDLLK